MVFSQAKFIKPDMPFNRDDRSCNVAPLFRKVFTLPEFSTAILHVCALGLGTLWLDGQPVTEDRFLAPASDYRKTLWYNSFDLSGILSPGEHVLVAMCGNGWYNETLETPWHHDQAEWRDHPKLILELQIDGQTNLVSNETWSCSLKSPVVYNQLRSGETYDARLADKRWHEPSYDDSDWQLAAVDLTPPMGEFRPYLAEPVRECALYPTQTMTLADHGRVIFDIGQNISGYIRLHVRQKSGDVIAIRYAEQVNPDLSLQLNDMERFYPSSDFQTDRFICSGDEETWSPMFTYHGFRYLEVTGLVKPTPDMVSGVFVHLDVRQTSRFSCSDPLLNQLFLLGQMATWSNLQHLPTDCPTREKLGWANDAQASTEQMLTNFDTVRFFKKWLVDIVDSIREDGAIPGIIPTWGWGFDWGTGPVSSGVLFEVPYKLYLFTGDPEPLVSCLPHFLHHLRYLLKQAGKDGLIGFGLWDWAGPFDPPQPAPTPLTFTDTLLTIKFVKIARLAAQLANDQVESDNLAALEAELTGTFKRAFLNQDGTCKVHEQTAVAMLIYHEVHDGLAPLAEQLVQTVKDHDYHHYCGMVGLRHLYEALDRCGRPDVGYRILTASGYPSYRSWVDQDATTLWETWQPGSSKNHHMYSDFMSWLIKSLVGIRPTFAAPGFAEVDLCPSFIPQLDWCEGSCDTVRGRIELAWHREGQLIDVKISLPIGVKGRFFENEFEAGTHHFQVPAPTFADS